MTAVETAYRRIFVDLVEKSTSDSREQQWLDPFALPTSLEYLASVRDRHQAGCVVLCMQVAGSTLRTTL